MTRNSGSRRRNGTAVRRAFGCGARPVTKAGSSGNRTATNAFFKREATSSHKSSRGKIEGRLGNGDGT